MASSTLLADLETGLVKARLRSLSLVSHPNSPIESPPVASPYIPATPVNTSATGSPAPPSSAASPFVLSPPANTPVDGLDSGQSTPTQRTAPIQLHPPDFIKIHHFHSPILWPTAPPNSPDTLRLTGSMDANMTATDETSIANIIQNLSRERKSEDEVDVSKYMVYGPARVPGQ